MAAPSLLQRLNVPAASAGPVRTKSQSSSRSNTPYSRRGRGDVDSQWSHDLFEDKSLSERISSQPTPPKANLNMIAQKALRDATSASGEQLSIKGASSASQGNVVEVSGLVAGTTAADVAAIFKRCGVVVNTKTIPAGNEVKVRVTFKAANSATAAVQKFHNQPADGKILSVRIIGSFTAGTSLVGRLGGSDGLDLVREEGTVDVLMQSDGAGDSKMRSDSLVHADPRAQILVAPPGANPADYVQAPHNNRGGQRRGRGGRGGRGSRRGGRGGARMDLD
ncbi:hypothetical protein BDN72DRAFT_790061 [Pluteus cervinus]|uniref:Uncharacterized protein n=1 Tax=Pluteus cervinus TaxID=181527 RepID=A0ACD3BAK5_9AGAR|nr:hypothetical protein BDN72DRAFT_790061 [Pluteus cervinus]